MGRVGNAQLAPHSIDDAVRLWARRKLAFAHPTLPVTPSLLHQRTLAGFERLGGVFRRDRGDLLVVIPWSLRLVRLLHLEQIGQDEAAAVGAQRALAEQRIVGRQFL